MAGLHFVLTADNSNFIQSVNEVKASVSTASTVLQNLGKNFDISTVESKIVTLNKVIRDNQEVINMLSSQMKKWEEDAREAFNNNQFDTLEVINKDIEEQKQKIAELTNETQQYISVLAAVQASAGQEITMQSVSAPKFFASEEDYQYAQKLQDKIIELQETIANFEGSEDELAGLRKELSQTVSQFHAANTAAAQAASELGENLGSRAAEASTMLYQLNAAVEKQQNTLNELKAKLAETAAELSNLESNGGGAQAIEDTRIKFDNLTQSVANAEQQLAILQGAQSDAQVSFSQVSAEIDIHDSKMVKMLGGYENYQNIISRLPGPVQGVIGSINGMTGAAKAFIATPLGAVIAAIVLVLQTLKTWFDSSVEGQKAFAEISGYVGGVLDQLKEIVITVGKAIYNAFKNPKKAIEDFWEAVKTNVVNRFKSLGDMAKSLGGLLKAALTFNTSAVKREFANLTNSFLQFGTGVENVTGKVGNFVKNTHEAAKTQAQLNKEAKEIDIAEHEKGIADAKRQKEMTEARATMMDNSKSKAEKEAARKEWKKLNQEQADADEALIDRKIKHQETTMSLTSNAIEDENKLRDLQAQKEQISAQKAQRELMMTRMDNRLDKASTGKTADQISSEQHKAHQKLLGLMRSQAEEKLKLDQDYEYQLWQNRIDLMEDGEDKVLEQMKLDQSKELASIEEQKKAAVSAEIARQKAFWDAREDEKAAGNKKYAKQVFNPGDGDILGNIAKLTELDNAIVETEKEIESLSSADILDNAAIEDAKNKLSDLQDSRAEIRVTLGDLNTKDFRKIADQYDALQSDLTAKQKKAEQDRLEAAKESMNAYLREFGSYQEKRQAIEEDYQKQIDAADNEGQRKMLMAQMNKALADLDYDEWVDTGAIALAFGDISKISESTINKLIADMEQYRDKVISTFDPDKIQKYEEALSKLRRAQSDNAFGAIANYVPDYFKQRKSTASRLDSAQEDVNALYEKRAEIYNRIISLQQKIREGESKGEDVSALKRKLEAEETGLRANATAAKDAVDKLKQLQEEWDMLETPQAKFEAVSGAVAGVANLLGGVVSQAADMCEALGAEGLGEALGYVGDAMGSVSNIASGFAQGNLVGGIAAAAGEIMNWVGKIARAGDNKKQKNIERLQEQIDTLNKSYEKIDKQIDKVFSTDASNLIAQQNTLLEQQKRLIRLQIAEEEAKKNTDDEKIKQWKEQLAEIDETIADNKQKAKEAIIGEDIKSAIGEFASAYAEAWNDGTDAAQASMKTVKSIITSALTELLKKNIQPAATAFYDALAEAMGKGYLTEADLAYLDALKAQIDALAAKSEEEYKKIQDRYKTLEELQEELTDISFDSVSDNFKSLLSDMESSTKDFTDSFADMLRNALIESLMDSKYDALLKEWYAEFAKAMEGGELTDEERERLRQQYDAIVQQGLADRDAINAIVGGGAYSQEASSGGWGSMSQDTADELNGRFTALTELNAINNNLVSEGNNIGMSILATLQSMATVSGATTTEENPSLLAIKDMMFLSTGYLEDIAKYTKQLNAISRGIDRLNDQINKKL